MATVAPFDQSVPVAGDKSLNIGGSLNAVSLSPDGSHAVVAGREGTSIVCAKVNSSFQC